MNQKVRWGVLGVANIAIRHVMPAMLQGEWSEVVAIASRSLEKARRASEAFGIPRAYGSYEELLADDQVEAIYNPLPNHLHVPWSIKAAEAGKHVLCEKPIALDASEAQKLVETRNRTGMKIQEAFMVRTHPQWLAVREMIRQGQIGEIRSVGGCFTYFNRDPENVRNKADIGGGALMDIGCYPITMSRFLFGEEPRRVFGFIERDPDFGTDRLTSATLEFPSGQSVFTCSTQSTPYQRMQILGTRGRIEVEIPFNAPADRSTRVFVDDGSDLFGSGVRTIEFPTCNQYTVQGDAFSRSIRTNSEQPIPLTDAVKNMAVIDAVFRSAKSGKWEKPESF